MKELSITIQNEQMNQLGKPLLRGLAIFFLIANLIVITIELFDENRNFRSILSFVAFYLPLSFFYLYQGYSKKYQEQFILGIYFTKDHFGYQTFGESEPIYVPIDKIESLDFKPNKILLQVKNQEPKEIEVSALGYSNIQQIKEGIEQFDFEAVSIKRLNAF